MSSLHKALKEKVSRNLKLSLLMKYLSITIFDPCDTILQLILDNVHIMV